MFGRISGGDRDNQMGVGCPLLGLGGSGKKKKKKAKGRGVRENVRQKTERRRPETEKRLAAITSQAIDKASGKWPELGHPSVHETGATSPEKKEVGGKNSGAKGGVRGKGGTMTLPTFQKTCEIKGRSRNNQTTGGEGKKKIPKKGQKNGKSGDGETEKPQTTQRCM